MNAVLKSVAKKISYVIAACIILAAVLVCVTRLLTPILDKHRSDFEKWASDLLATPVTIEKVQASWYQYQPEINLYKVTVLNKDTKQPNLQIQKISIFFSIPQSLWQRKFVPSGIMVSGTNINVHETATGEFSLQGFPSLGGFEQQPFQSETKFNDVAGWLSTQPRLILQNIDIRYSSPTHKPRWVTLYNLSIENDNSKHSILGKAILHQDIPTEVTMAVSWLGTKVDLATINAKIYLYVSGLSAAQWLKEYVWNGWQIDKGIVSAKVWATWDQGTFQKIQSTFQAYHVDLFSEKDKSLHNINRLSGNIGWQRDGNGQIIAADDILIDLPTHLWPVTSFYLKLMPNTSGILTPSTINIGYIDISDVQAFLFATPGLVTDATQKTLSELQLKGAIQNVAMSLGEPWNDWHKIKLDADLNRIRVSQWHGFPGIINLSGNIKWNNTQGDFILRSSRMQFQYDSVFANAIPIDQLTGSVNLTIDNANNWIFRTSSLQVLNNDMAANINGSFTVPPASPARADLQANFTMQQVNHITRYLPLHIFEPALIKWLQQAFLSGEIKSANAILRGPLKEFPFDHNDGTFLVSGEVNNIDLHYAPNWPTLQHTSGRLTFSGRHMAIDVDRAQLLNIPLTNLHGEIPYLGTAQPQVLHIQSGLIDTDFSQGLKFVRASPLQTSIGKMFNGMEVSGPMTLKLGLKIPLKQPETTQVQGDITLKNAHLKVTPLRMELNNLIGQLHFTEKTTTAQEISGQLFNKPIKLNISTIQKANDLSLVQVNFAHKLDITDLENWLKVPFSKVVNGSTDVTGEVNFSLKTPTEIRLHSNLVGVAVNLPDQYAKKAEEARDFSADIIAQETQPLRVKLTYGNLLSSALILTPKQDTFSLTGVDLRFGTGEAAWPTTPGLYITGEFDDLAWDKIKKYVGQTDQASFTTLPLRAIDIRAKSLTLPGQRILQIHLQITPNQNNWNIVFSSPDIVGKIDTPTNFNGSGLITAQFRRLRLHSTPNDNNLAPSINVKSLPKIAFSANDVSYNNIPLGQIYFNTYPSLNGLNIQNLRVASSLMDLQAQGEWTQSNVTRMQGILATEHVSDLLNSFGFDVHNFVSNKGKVKFNLGWRDAPFAPSLTNLSGSASLDLGQGAIVDVGQASGAKMDIGRMLSIFSLQNIPRRLTFDFSDVFQKGYSFDFMRGDFSFRNGNAFTNNLRFDGAIARVSINGRIGLKNKDYDFTLSITPYVTSLTSSLPVAAAWILTGPVGGMAALAVNTAIGSAVSNAATYYYSVKGPWSNPIWQSISVNRRTR